MLVSLNYYVYSGKLEFKVDGRTSTLYSKVNESEYLKFVYNFCLAIGYDMPQEDLDALSDGDITDLELIESFCNNNNIDFESEVYQDR